MLAGTCLLSRDMDVDMYACLAFRKPGLECLFSFFSYAQGKGAGGKHLNRHTIFIVTESPTKVVRNN
jgi:hypothetical protein